MSVLYANAVMQSRPHVKQKTANENTQGAVEAAFRIRRIWTIRKLDECGIFCCCNQCRKSVRGVDRSLV